MILNNVADIHRKQSDYVRAEGIYMEALTNLENSLGKDHIEVAEVRRRRRRRRILGIGLTNTLL